jgi:hypothetical protein
VQGAPVGGRSGSGTGAVVQTGAQTVGNQAGRQVSGLTLSAGGGAPGGDGGGLASRRWRDLVAAAVPAALIALAATPWVLVGRRRKQLLAYGRALPRRVGASRIRLLED